MRYCFSILAVFAAAVLLASPAAMAVPGTWAGYAIMDGSVAANGTVVSAVCDNNSTWKANTTVWPGHGEYSESVPQGYYTLSFECITNVNFYICGIAVPLAAQTFTSGPHYNGTATPNFNISVSKLASGASCSYSCACSGGYCCSGATQYTAGTGTGTCQATACAAATTTTTAAPSSGGGGGAATTTTTLATTTTLVTTTTTTLPPITVTATVASVASGGTGTFTFTQTVLTDVQFTAVNSISDGQITVTQSSSVPAAVPAPASDSVYGYVSLKEKNIKSTDVSSVKIKFKVEKKWLTDGGIDVATVALNRYSGGKWNALATAKLSEDATYAYFEAVSPGLSEFAITGKKAVTTTTQPVAPTTTIPTTTQPPFVLPKIPGVSDTMLYIAIGIIAVIILAVAVWKFKLIRF